MDSSTIFIKTAEVLREAGWGQGAYRPKGGGYCVLGAMNVAAGLPYDDPSWLHESPFRFLEDEDNQLRLTRWNDTEGRTKEEVIEALERLAAGHDLDDILSPAHADT